MVYTAEHPALAALEILNGWEVYANLSGYLLYRCTFGAAAVLDAPPDLNVDDRAATRAFGDAWVRGRASVALRVRSAAVVAAYNYLLNPDTPISRRSDSRPWGRSRSTCASRSLCARPKGRATPRASGAG